MATQRIKVARRVVLTLFIIVSAWIAYEFWRRSRRPSTESVLNKVELSAKGKEYARKLGQCIPKYGLLGLSTENLLPGSSRTLSLYEGRIRLLAMWYPPENLLPSETRFLWAWSVKSDGSDPVVELEDGKSSMTRGGIPDFEEYLKEGVTQCEEGEKKRDLSPAGKEKLAKLVRYLEAHAALPVTDNPVSGMSSIFQLEGERVTFMVSVPDPDHPFSDPENPPSRILLRGTASVARDGTDFKLEVGGSANDESVPEFEKVLDEALSKIPQR